jgi:hypothetical protein
MTHNTFAARNRLVKDAGMTPEQAEILLEVVQEQTEGAAATKADMADLRGELKALRMELRYWISGAVIVVLGAIKWVH